jgi:NAD+ kinase
MRGSVNSRSVVRLFDEVEEIEEIVMSPIFAPSGTIREVLLILKETEYAQAVSSDDHERVLALIANGDKTAAAKLEEHNQHADTIRCAKAYFGRRGIKFRSVLSKQMARQPRRKYDLRVAIGGDGTFLTAAAATLDEPLVGIRSTPSSLGHFTIADWTNFESVLDRILDGKLVPQRLFRLAVQVRRVVVKDGAVTYRNEAIPTPVLNDVFIHNDNSAIHYELQVGDKAEVQSSSGVWIGSPAGSTAALRSGGGKVLPITDEKMEFVVQMPILRPDRPVPRMLRGIVEAGGEILFTSHTRASKVWMDGPWRETLLKTGDKVTVKRHPHDLLAFVDPDVNKKYTEFFGLYQPW